MAKSAAVALLGRQLKQMQSDKDIPGISCGLVDNNMLEWEVMLMISDDCKFYGGMHPTLHQLAVAFAFVHVSASAFGALIINITLV